MQVRIRMSVGPRLALKRRPDAKLALAVASLLTPAAVLCVVMALWGVLSDTNYLQKFVIEEGLFSHWQVWLALGIAIQSAGLMLERYGKQALATIRR
jgi:hypothetical protein